MVYIQKVWFCTIWYDRDNEIGILEPVGTNADYRKMGLARSVIGEAIRLVAKEGAEKVYVVTDKEFYLRIGFKCIYKLNVWEKVIR